MKTLRQLEQEAAVKALIITGNQSKAANALDVSRGTLRKLLAEYSGDSAGQSRTAVRKFAQENPGATELLLKSEE